MTHVFAIETTPEAPLATVLTDRVSTAGWRTQRPEVDNARCTKCAVCWKFCPDVAILFDGEGFPTINLTHCKGCGLCAEECPTGAITMVLWDEEASF